MIFPIWRGRIVIRKLLTTDIECIDCEADSTEFGENTSMRESGLEPTVPDILTL